MYVNLQGAAKLANSALGKYKNNPLLKTLKAVALDRAGKSQEAFQVCACSYSIAKDMIIFTYSHHGINQFTIPYSDL